MQCLSSTHKSDPEIRVLSGKPLMGSVWSPAPERLTGDFALAAGDCGVPAWRGTGGPSGPRWSTKITSVRQRSSSSSGSPAPPPSPLEKTDLTCPYSSISCAYKFA
jgi:hypothetical protein